MYLSEGKKNRGTYNTQIYSKLSRPNTVPSRTLHAVYRYLEQRPHSVLYSLIPLTYTRLSLSLYIYIYIFNAFISGHVGTPEIAGRYLAVFQVLISSRTRVPPTPARRRVVAPLCRLRPLCQPPPLYPHHRVPR